MATLRHMSQKAREIASIAEDVAQSPVYKGFETTADNYHRRYDWRRATKTSHVDYDCSELSSVVVRGMTKSMREVNTGSYQWKTNLDRIDRAFVFGSTTESQRHALKTMGEAPIAAGKRNQIRHMDFKVGMVIYFEHPPTKSGYNGHVGVVTKNPETGKLMISESIGGQNRVGVVHRDIHDFFTLGKIINHPQTKVFVYDPFAKDREMLNKLEARADQVRTWYAEASKNFAEHGSDIKNVHSGKGNARYQFISDYVANKMNHRTPNYDLKQAQNEADQNVNQPQLAMGNHFGDLFKRLNLEDVLKEHLSNQDGAHLGMRKP